MNPPAESPNPGPLEPAATPSLAQPPPACWNETGIYGNRLCPKLPEFVHCRNCPVFSSAARQLLEQGLGPDYRRERSEHFALAGPRSDAGNSSAVLFRLGTEWLALPTHALQEIVEQRPIHSLPHRRQGVVLGMVNVRGELLIAVSLSRLLRLEPASQRPNQSYERLLVANWNGSRFALPVEEVRGPQRFHPQELKAPPATVLKAATSFTRAVLDWQQTTVGLLDPELVFSTLNRSLQ